ncbi:permease prefix domain 1-containing protein [Deinococcus malanensis]|uniref:permease prefix domain 1-containing protein n=1 Tax=Deinococcus malanensis TaxID=1706855 RepID=UPI00363F6F01
MGLPPSKRTEVRDELEEHLFCRVEQLEWQGATPEHALHQALSELGSPVRVSAALNGVYNMPKMILLVGTAALAISAALYALAGGAEPMAIPLTTSGVVSPNCVRGVVPPADTIHVISQSKRDEVTCYVKKNQSAPWAHSANPLISGSALEQLAKDLGGEGHVSTEGFLL